MRALAIALLLCSMAMAKPLARPMEPLTLHEVRALEAEQRAVRAFQELQMALQAMSQAHEQLIRDAHGMSGDDSFDIEHGVVVRKAPDPPKPASAATATTVDGAKPKPEPKK